jgi:hypothetical protein
MKESGILIKNTSPHFSFPAIYSYVLYCRDGKTPCFVNSLIPPALVVSLPFTGPITP